MKLLVKPKLTEKEAKKIFKEFFDAKTTKEKQRIWDKLVPYANAHPKLYREMTQEKINERRPNVHGQEVSNLPKMRVKNAIHSTQVNKGRNNRNMPRLSCKRDD